MLAKIDKFFAFLSGFLFWFAIFRWFFAYDTPAQDNWFQVVMLIFAVEGWFLFRDWRKALKELHR